MHTLSYQKLDEYGQNVREVQRETSLGMDIEMDLTTTAAGSTSTSSTSFVTSDRNGYITFAVNASWAVNWFLLIAKGIVFVMSSSKAVLAALVDSAVDLVSQAVLALAETYMSRFSRNYPVGRSRLEALSVIACAFIMSTASLEGTASSFTLFHIYKLILSICVSIHSCAVFCN